MLAERDNAPSVPHEFAAFVIGGERIGHGGAVRGGIEENEQGEGTARQAMRTEVIGLLGGSFDPPHAGHVRATLEAMRRFDIPRVWWLVSPGNPLKSRPPEPLAARMALARAILSHPRVEVSDLEARLGTVRTADTLAALRRLYPRTRFVWLMGADNLAQFHLWSDWRDIAAHHPIGVLARPGHRLRARTSPAARAMARWRLKGPRARLLGRVEAPAWAIANIPMSPLSSTALRRAAGRE